MEMFQRSSGEKAQVNHEQSRSCEEYLQQEAQHQDTTRCEEVDTKTALPMKQSVIPSEARDLFSFE
jgi:hypothetical protein